MPSGARVWLAAVTTLGGVSLLSDVQAGEFTCHVPVAVLCQGCAERVVISLQSGGGCRVSFSPTVVAASPPLAGAVDLQIYTAATPEPARRKTLYRRGRVALARKSSSHPCFEFKDQQYCE